MRNGAIGFEQLHTNIIRPTRLPSSDEELARVERIGFLSWRKQNWIWTLSSGKWTDAQTRYPAVWHLITVRQKRWSTEWKASQFRIQVQNLSRKTHKTKALSVQWKNAKSAPGGQVVGMGAMWLMCPQFDYRWDFLFMSYLVVKW